MSSVFNTLRKDPFAYSPALPGYSKQKMWDAIRLAIADSDTLTSKSLLIMADNFERMKTTTGLDLEPAREVSIPSVAEIDSGKILHDLA